MLHQVLTSSRQLNFYNNKIIYYNNKNKITKAEGQIIKIGLSKQNLNIK